MTTRDSWDMMGPMRVIIIEDDHRYRHGLETLFKHTPGLELAGSFGDGREALRTLERRHRLDGGVQPADVVVTDLEMPHVDGIEGTRRLKALWPNLPIVVVTVFEEPATILKAICAGADGYLLKGIEPVALLEQLRTVHAGGAPLSSGVAQTVLGLLRSNASAPTAPAPTRLDLTARQLEILRLIVRGKSTREIANGLSLSIKTVETHRSQIMKRLQIYDVAGLVLFCVREQIISLDD